MLSGIQARQLRGFAARFQGVAWSCKPGDCSRLKRCVRRRPHLVQLHLHLQLVDEGLAVTHLQVCLFPFRLGQHGGLWRAPQVGILARLIGWLAEVLAEGRLERRGWPTKVVAGSSLVP